MAHVNSQTKQKTIMVADDNHGILDMMKLILEHAGYAVKTTSDGRDVRNMEAPFPDLLFLDLLLSGEDGHNLCMMLKDRRETRHIPIIILSANRDIERIAGACEADGFLSKPFQMKEMLALIERYA